MTIDAKARIIVSATVEETIRQFDQLAKAVKKVDKAAQAAAKRNEMVAKTTRTMGLALMGAATAGGAFIFQATKLAARVETLGVVTATLGKNVGKTEDEIRSLEQAVVSQGITLQKARQAIAMMMQAQVDLAHSTDLARMAQNAAVIANVDSSEAFQRLIAVIQTGNIRMGRTLGLQLNFMDAYKKTAKELGKTTQELTSFEKVTARTNEVLRQGGTIAGAYDAAMETAGKQMLSLNRHWEESRRLLGEEFLPLLSEGVTKVTDFLKAWQDMDAAQRTGTIGAIGAAVQYAAVAGAMLLVGSKVISATQSFQALDATMKAATISATAMNLAIFGVIAIVGAAVIADAKWQKEIKARMKLTKEGIKEIDSEVKSFKEFVRASKKVAEANEVAAYTYEELQAVLAAQGIDIATVDWKNFSSVLVITASHYRDFLVDLATTATYAEDLERANMPKVFDETANSVGLMSGALGKVNEGIDGFGEKSKAAFAFADTGSRNLVQQLKDQIKFMALGGVQLAMSATNIGKALSQGLDPELAKPLLDDLDLAFLNIQVGMDELNMNEAVKQVQEEYGGSWQEAHDMITGAGELINELPTEIGIVLTTFWAPVPPIPPELARLLGFANISALPYPKFLPTPAAAPLPPASFGGAQERQHGGPLAGITKVGEKGWEYIMGGVVIPHRVSMELERLGIRSQRNYAMDAGGGGSGSPPPAQPPPTDFLSLGTTRTTDTTTATVSGIAQATQIAEVAAQQQEASQAAFTMTIAAGQAENTKAQKQGTKELSNKLEDVIDQLQVMNDMLPDQIQEAVNQVVG